MTTTTHIELNAQEIKNIVAAYLATKGVKVIGGITEVIGTDYTGHGPMEMPQQVLRAFRATAEITQ